jgi:hypothetical protein
MHTSTDARRGIGQKNAQFWINVATHYAKYKPEGGADRPARSLETKWSDIKQSVANSREGLPVDRRDLLSPNGQAPSTESKNEQSKAKTQDGT